MIGAILVVEWKSMEVTYIHGCEIGASMLKINVEEVEWQIYHLVSLI